MKTRSLVKGQKSGAQFPVNTEESNEKGDRQAKLLFTGTLTLSVLLTIGILLFHAQHLYESLSQAPVDWVNVGIFTLGAALTLWIGRGLIWLSLFGATMFAAKRKAWKSQEELCRTAIKNRGFFPGGAVTAALMLVQSLVSRGQNEEAIQVGEEQWGRYGSNAKHAQNLAPMCTMLGLAHQIKGETKQSVTWNERAIESYQKVLEQVTKPKGLTRLAVMQSPNLASSVNMQLAVAYFNNAMSHFNQMNYRPAKDNYRKAVEHANLGPESQEKMEILKVSKEQLARLKHS